MEINVILGCAASVFAILFGFSAWQNTRLKKEGALGKSSGVVLTEISYIKVAVDDIRRKQDRQSEQFIALCERVAAAEASTKQAHLRIDRTERSNRHEKLS